MNRKHLLQLSADLDRVIELRSDDESHMLRNAAAGVGIAGAGVGAYYGDKAVMAKYGQRKLLGMGDNIPGHITTPPSTPAGGAKDFASITPGTQTPATFTHVTQPASVAIGRKSAYKAAMNDFTQSAGSRLDRATKGAAHAYGVSSNAGQGFLKSAWSATKRGLKSLRSSAPMVAKVIPKLFSSRHENLLTLSAELDDVVEFGRGDIFKKMTGGHAVPRPPKGHTGEFYESAGKRYRIDTPALQAQDLSEMREMMPGSKYRFGNKRTLREAPYRNLSAELDGVIELGIMDKVRSFIPKLKDLKSGYSANRLAGAGRLDSISQSAVAGAKKLNAGGYGYMPKKQIEIPGSLSQFSAELDQVINFDFMGMVKKYGPAVGKSALKWGGIGAAGGAVAGGVSGALSDDPNRTALSGAMSGAMSGGIFGALGGAGMRGMKINSAIKKAAGMKAARLAGTPGAAAAPSAAAAPTATAAAAPTATAAADQMAAAAGARPSAAKVWDADLASTAAAPTGLPAGVRPRGADELLKPKSATGQIPTVGTVPMNTMDKPWNIENYKNMPQESKKRLASAYQAGLDPRPAMSGFGEHGVEMYRKKFGFSSRLQSLVQLSAELGRVISFGSAPRATAAYLKKTPIDWAKMTEAERHLGKQHAIASGMYAPEVHEKVWKSLSAHGKDTVGIDAAGGREAMRSIMAASLRPKLTRSLYDKHLKLSANV